MVPMMEENEDYFKDEVLEKLRGVPVIPRGDRAKKVMKYLKPVLGDIEPSQVIIRGQTRTQSNDIFSR